MDTTGHRLCLLRIISIRPNYIPCWRIRDVSRLKATLNSSRILRSRIARSSLLGSGRIGGRSLSCTGQSIDRRALIEPLLYRST